MDLENGFLPDYLDDLLVDESQDYNHSGKIEATQPTNDHSWNNRCVPYNSSANFTTDWGPQAAQDCIQREQREYQDPQCVNLNQSPCFLEELLDFSPQKSALKQIGTTNHLWSSQAVNFKQSGSGFGSQSFGCPENRFFSQQQPQRTPQPFYLGQETCSTPQKPERNLFQVEHVNPQSSAMDIEETSSKSSTSVLSWLEFPSDPPLQMSFEASEESLRENQTVHQPEYETGRTQYPQMSVVDQDIAALDAFFRARGQNKNTHGSQYSYPLQTGSSLHQQQDRHTEQFFEPLRLQANHRGSHDRDCLGLGGWRGPMLTEPAHQRMRVESDPNMQEMFKYTLTGDSSSTGLWVEQHNKSKLLPALSKLAVCLTHLLSKLAKKQTVQQGAKHLITQHKLTDEDLKSFLGYGKVALWKSTSKTSLDKMVSKMLLYLLLRKSSGRGLPHQGTQLLEDAFRGLLLV